MADAPAPVADPATPPPDPAPDPEPDPTPVPDDKTDWKAEARKWERNAKKALTDVETLKAQTMTEQEKAVAAAVDAAKDEGRSAALQEAGVKLVAAEIRVAAAGRPVDLDALIGGIDPAKFLDDEGNPDTAAIKAWVDKVAPPVDPLPPGTPNLGARRSGAVAPLGSDPLLQALKNVTGAT